MAAKKSSKGEGIRVSLLPAEEGSRIGRHAGINLVLLIVLIILVVGIVGVTMILRVRAGRLNQARAAREVALLTLQQQLKTAEEHLAQLGNVGQLIGLAKALLPNHIASEQIVALLESTTIPEVTFQNIAADANGSIVLGGRTPTYAAMTRQVLAWHADSRISEARLSNVTAVLDKDGTVEGLEFSVTLMFVKGLVRFDP